MQKNPDDFAFEDAMRLAATPAGQHLIALLKQSNPNTLQSALEKAAQGDMTQAKNILQPLMASEEIQKLLQQLGG